MLSKIELARSIVLRFGWNSLCYQILNPGFLYWFNPHNDAVVGYVEHAGYRIVAGAPICAPEQLLRITTLFEQDSKQAGKKVCYFGVQERLLSLRGGKQDRILIGSQPVWSPQNFTTTFSAKSSLQAQLRRAENHFVQVRELANIDVQSMEALNHALQSWITERKMPCMKFLVEPNTLTQLLDRRIFVATQRGNVVAYLVASPIPLRNGWLIEQQIRTSASPNGTVELLIAHAMQALVYSDAEFVTLGLSPLSTINHQLQANVSFSVANVLRFTKKFGSRFYNFQGLQAFKQKFAPQSWEPIYALTPNHKPNLHTLYAIASAFSGGEILRFMKNAVMK